MGAGEAGRRKPERASCHLHLLSLLAFVLSLPLPPGPFPWLSGDLTHLSLPYTGWSHSQGPCAGLGVCSAEDAMQGSSCNPARPGWGN